MRKLRFVFDYYTYPIWEELDDGLDNLEPDELPISQELKQSIYALDDKYQETYDASYPPNSGFKTEEEKRFFIEERLTLFNRLKAELPNNFKITLGDTFDDE